MKYIVNPEDYKTKEDYIHAIDMLISRKEEKMKDCRMRLLQLNNSALGALYMEHLEYEACKKRLTEYGKEKYGKAKEDYMNAYTYLQKEYDRAEEREETIKKYENQIMELKQTEIKYDALLVVQERTQQRIEKQDSEISDIYIVPIKDAIRMIPFPDTRAILRKAQRFIKNKKEQ